MSGERRNELSEIGKTMTSSGILRNALNVKLKSDSKEFDCSAGIEMREPRIQLESDKYKVNNW